MEEIVSLKELAKLAANSYKEAFGHEPEFCVFAPGRVNLIGEHTDYNDGFVFPMALPLVSLIVGSKAKDSDSIRVATICADADDPKEVEIPVSSLAELTPGAPKWANYVKGVLAFHPKRDSVPAFTAMIASSVPCGSGLSSSAALETATFTFLDALLDIERSTEEEKKERAFKCQKAEHEFAGVPCGIMDQLISSIGLEDHAILIDCRSLEAKPILFDNPELAILITNSNVKHELSTGEYANRRRECENAAAILGKKKLREGTTEDLKQSKELLDETCYKRARHVILENERCEEAYESLKKKDYKKFGKLMNQSHDSLRDDYEVSCKELDQLVSLALEKEGVYGSRMTGGGFGGCTVTLLEKKDVTEVIEHIKDGYSGKPTFYLCTPFAGAEIVNLKELLSC